MDKSIRILLTFADGAVHGVRDIARRLSIPKSTASRLIRDLADAHLLARDESSGGYRLGAEVVRLGTAYLRGLNVRDAASPEITRLQSDCRETVALQVREGMERVVIACLESSAPIRSGFSEGDRFPLHAGAAGKVLVAFASEEEREQLITGLTYEALTEHTIVDPEALAIELANIRRFGYATSEQEVSAESASIAAPIIGATGLLAALVVTGPVFRMSPQVLEELAPKLLDSAKSISIRLGMPLNVPPPG